MATEDADFRRIVICAGLSCLDMQLLGASDGSLEAIHIFEQLEYCAGGSACMTASTLGLVDTDCTVFAVTKTGDDAHADILLGQLKRAGVDDRLVRRAPNVMTSLAVLPIYRSGGRGCFVNLAANDGFTLEDMRAQLGCTNALQPARVANFHFGYPHLLQRLQGDALRQLCEECRELFPKAVLSVDLNGVTQENHSDAVLGPCLPLVDVIHLNEEEADIVGAQTASAKRPRVEDALAAISELSPQRQAAVRHLHAQGVAVVLLSIGSRGSIVSTTSDAARLERCRGQVRSWVPGHAAHAPAFRVPPDSTVNANGAGDALVGGFILAASWPAGNVDAAEACIFASLVARQRCASTLRDGPAPGNEGTWNTARELMQRVRDKDLPEEL